MLFQKKGAAGSKKAQTKKKGQQVFEADNDNSSDFEGDSDEEMTVQRTPQNKTTKGKNSQCMSEKKISFEITGKKTPGKTPQKHTFIAKKQSTPGVKGMKGNTGVQKKESQDEEEEDDDNSEDDDDIELGLDNIDMDDDDEEEDGDDEEEEEDDDDEEEEEDDDDEEEEQKPAQNQNKSDSRQQKNNVQSPIKVGDKSKGTLTPKAKSPKNEVEEKSDNKRDRDLRSLFVGGFPKDVTVDELKALSPDIVSAYLPDHNKKKTFAFLQFSSEAKAEANYEILKNKTLRGEPFNIDFMGEKRKDGPRKDFMGEKRKDGPRKENVGTTDLFVVRISLDATIADVAIHFPKAYEVSFNRSTNFRSAIIRFETKEDAAEALKLKVIEINGQKLVLLYDKSKPFSKKNKGGYGKNKRNAGQPPAKRRKF